MGNPSEWENSREAGKDQVQQHETNDSIKYNQEAELEKGKEWIKDQEPDYGDKNKDNRYNEDSMMNGEWNGQSRSQSPMRDDGGEREFDERYFDSEKGDQKSGRKKRSGNGSTKIVDSQNPTPNRVLGIFGMHPDTTESMLKDVFTEYGRIEKINLIYDRNTNMSRNFGFIYFEKLDDAQKALDQMNGTILHGRKIRVDYSKTQKAHSPTPGRYMGVRERSERHAMRQRRDDRYSVRNPYAEVQSRDRGYDRDYDRYERGYDRSFDRYDHHDRISADDYHRGVVRVPMRDGGYDHGMDRCVDHPNERFSRFDRYSTRFGRDFLENNTYHGGRPYERGYERGIERIPPGRKYSRGYEPGYDRKPIRVHESRPYRNTRSLSPHERRGRGRSVSPR